MYASTLRLVVAPHYLIMCSLDKRNVFRFQLNYEKCHTYVLMVRYHIYMYRYLCCCTWSYLIYRRRVRLDATTDDSNDGSR